MVALHFQSSRASPRSTKIQASLREAREEEETSNEETGETAVGERQARNDKPVLRTPKLKEGRKLTLREQLTEAKDRIYEVEERLTAMKAKMRRRKQQEADRLQQLQSLDIMDASNWALLHNAGGYITFYHTAD